MSSPSGCTVAANKKFPFRFRGTPVQRLAVDKKTVIRQYSPWARATLLFFNITKTSPITTSTVGSQTVARRHRSFRLADSRITVFIHGEALYGRATETERELFIGGYCTHDQREKGNWKVFQAAAFLSHWIHTAAYIPSRVIVAAYKIVTMQPRPWQSDTAWISEIRPT